MTIIFNVTTGGAFPARTTATCLASPSAGQTGFNTTTNATGGKIYQCNEPVTFSVEVT